jgi:ferrous iron transport protein A
MEQGASGRYAASNRIWPIICGLPFPSKEISTFAAGRWLLCNVMRRNTCENAGNIGFQLITVLNYCREPFVRLSQLPLRQPAFVDQIDWEALSHSEAQRLREFGICEGASVEALHRAGFLAGGALACRIGRMTVAMRRNHAAAITVRTGEDANAPEHERRPS